MAQGKAEDAGGLTPAKDDNTALCHFGHRTLPIFKCVDYIRPLAKLSKAVKVADTGNQGKAESKALSAVTVTLREDTESFKKTDGVFNKDTFS